MRHKKRTVKLGRTTSHRNAMLSSLVCHLIEQRRITTTLPKARAARSLAEKMVTLGKDGTLAARRRAVSRLRRTEQVSKLFEEVAPSFSERNGGYTRIIKLGRRGSDSSEMAILEWVEPGPPDKKAKKKAPKKEAAKKEEPPKAEEAEERDASASEEPAAEADAEKTDTAEESAEESKDSDK